MKQIILAGVACAALALPAAAADAPVALKAPPKGFNWTGFYAGVNSGYAWGRTGGVQQQIDLEYLDSHTRGWVIGGQFGYNYQFNNNFVLGGRLEINWTGIRGHKSDEVFISGSFEDASYNSRLRYVAMAGFTIGMAVERSHFYAILGVATGDNKIRAGIDPEFVSASQNHTGWAGGFGFEHASTPQDRFFIEYLHVNLGRETYDLGSVDYGGTTIYYGHVPVRVRFDLVRFGYNRGL